MGIALKKEELQAAVWSTARPAMAVSAGLSVLSLLLAGLIAQRITRPIAELRDRAAALLKGPSPAFKPGTPEIEELWSALQRAAFERNLVDAALRQLNERFVAGEEAAGGFVYDWNAKTDDCWRSEGLITLLGYHPREVPPSSAGWVALIHPDDRSRIAISPALYGSTDGRYSTKSRSAQGRPLGLALDRGRTTTAPDGRLVRLIGSAIDVSERKRSRLRSPKARTEPETRSPKSRRFTILPGSACAFWTVSCAMSVNKRLAEMNGLPVAGHIGKTVREIVPEIADEAEEIAARIFETGLEVPDVELSGTTAATSGGLRFWLEQWMPLRNAAGEIIGINVVVEDITDRKKHEEQILLLMREVNHRAKHAGRRSGDRPAYSHITPGRLCSALLRASAGARHE